MANPLFLLGALGVGLAWALASGQEAKAKTPERPESRPGQPKPGARGEIPGVPSIPAPPGSADEPPISPAIIARMVAALASGNVAEIRRVASELEAEGFRRPASELRSAADAIDAANRLQRPVTPPAVPIPVVVPPPGAFPVRPPAPAPAPAPPVKPGRPELPIPVVVPPPGAVPVPPPAATPHPPGAIPNTATLVGKTALMLWESAPGPVRDVALLTRYKQSVGLKDSGNLYGPGTAKSLMSRDIVPPTPWDWPANKTAAARDLRDNYKFKASKDLARREEWQRAASDLGRFV